MEITWSWGTLRGLYGDAEITFNENGTPIYQYNYNWMLCQEPLEQWGAGIASDVPPILEAGEFIDEGNDKELAKLREIPERYFTS